MGDVCPRWLNRAPSAAGPVRRRGRRRRARLSVLVLLAVLAAVGLTPGPAAAAPTGAPAAENPADTLAAQVAQLTAALAAPQAAVAHARALAAIALDDYQAKEVHLAAAREAAERAAAEADRVGAALAGARTDLLAFARRSYMSGSTSPGAASLITSNGSAQLTERMVLLGAAGAYRVDVLGRFTTAQEQAQQARADAQAAVDRAGELQQQAAAALATAQNAERTARRQAAQATSGQPALQAQLDQARGALVALVGEQEAQRRISRAQAAAAATAGTGALPPVDNRPARPPSPTVVAVAIAAARAELGTPYAWGGGGSSGPGYGIDPDAAVIGFDCSGLTQYAYAQAGASIPRNSRAQFARLPKVAAGDLTAGDLVFWAVDPADPATIHHVAIYLGDGQVIQAPQSGAVVTVSPMWWSGFAGAVRPTG